MIYLLENLDHNTSVPEIIMFLNEANRTGREDKLFPMNENRVYEKDEPGNLIPTDRVDSIGQVERKIHAHNRRHKPLIELFRTPLDRPIIGEFLVENSRSKAEIQQHESGKLSFLKDH